MADEAELAEEHRGATHDSILIVRLRQPNRLRIHQSVMDAIGRFQDAEWPGLLVVMRDATMSTSRAAGVPVEKQSGATRVTR